LSVKSARPLEIKVAPYTSSGVSEIVVKNGAVAINPIDWFKQSAGNLMFSWIKYLFIVGSDLAGEVVEVGRVSRASRLATVSWAMLSAWPQRATSHPKAHFRNTP
jgi:NADPH:quinone reductase-like Zn-dependent oxidoreductase